LTHFELNSQRHPLHIVETYLTVITSLIT
jgi:hypothetical protein